MVKVIALDIDGTILDHHGSLSPRVHRAITAVAGSTKYELVLATGRAAVGVPPVWQQLQLSSGHAVACNGAALLSFDVRGVHEILDKVMFHPKEALLALKARMPGARFAVEDVHRGFRVTEHFPPGELQGEIDIVPFQGLLDLPVVRCIMRSPEHTPADFLALSAELGLAGASYAVGWSAWMDISPIGVDKAYGLAKLADELGVKSADVLAIGDGRNDLSMFAWAGQSIAMGQAEEEVQAAADLVCGSVYDDGLADVLERLLN